jgi:hypothetical protein
MTGNPGPYQLDHAYLIGLSLVVWLSILDRRTATPMQTTISGKIQYLMEEKSL